MIRRFLVCCGLGLGTLVPSCAFAEDHTVIPAGAPLAVSLQVESLSSNVFQIGTVLLDKKGRIITVPARVRLRDQLVEYALVHESGKVHEALFTTLCAPAQINLAFVLLGLSRQDIPILPGQPILPSPTNTVSITVTWETNGIKSTHPLGELITIGELSASQSPMSSQSWQYNGSLFNGEGFAAQREGSIVSLIRDPSALINNIGSDLDNDQVHHPNSKSIPPENWPVFLSFKIPLISSNELPTTPRVEPERGDKTNLIPLLQTKPKSL